MISFTSDFIPRLVYLYMYSQNGTMHGFVNHTLSFFNVSDFQNGTAPSDPLDLGYEVHICRYHPRALLEEPTWWASGKPRFEPGLVQKQVTEQLKLVLCSKCLGAAGRGNTLVATAKKSMVASGVAGSRSCSLPPAPRWHRLPGSLPRVSDILWPQTPPSSSFCLTPGCSAGPWGERLCSNGKSSGLSLAACLGPRACP